MVTKVFKAAEKLFTFRCCIVDASTGEHKECSNEALWYVWFSDCGGLYTYACTECLKPWLDQKENYVVVQVSRIGHESSNEHSY